MKLGIIPENILERVALAAGVVPRPMLDTLVAMMLARTIMAATKLGIFEALAPGPLPAHQVAAQCGTDPRATEKLLTALAGAGYVRAAHGQYALAPVARTWLLKDSPQSLRDKMLMQFTEWEWIAGYEEFVGSGTPRDIHERMSDDEWGLYQRSMREVVPQVMEGQIMDICPLVFRRLRFEHAEPVVNAFFSQAIATLRCKDICSIGFATSPKILIQRLACFVDEIDIAPLAAFITNMEPPDFWTDMSMGHLQPGDITDTTSCPVT